jgi:hypothetical protein
MSRSRLLALLFSPRSQTRRSRLISSESDEKGDEPRHSRSRLALGNYLVPPVQAVADQRPLRTIRAVSTPSASDPMLRGAVALRRGAHRPPPALVASLASHNPHQIMLLQLY